MALSRIKVWIAGEVLTASDLNSEFNNILNNPISLISPLTSGLDIDGQTLTLDAAGVTTVVSSASQAWQFTPGAKSGTPSTTGGIQNWVASTYTDSNTAGSGTATSWVAHALQRPTLAATNSSVTTTNAATFYIANAPAAGTNQTLTNAYALWVDDGITRLDGAVDINSTVDISGALTLSGGSLWEIEGAAVASAATTNIWSTDGSTIHITGTTTITSFGTAPQAGAWKKVIFDGALTLTHGANLNLQGSANITTAANDFAFVYADTTTLFRVLYFKASGAAVVEPTTAANGSSVVLISSVTASASNYFQFDNPFSSSYDEYEIHIIGARPTTDGNVFKLQAATGAGPTYDTAGNYTDGGNLNEGTANAVFGTAGRTYISLSGETGVGNASTKPVDGIIRIRNPMSSAFHKCMQIDINFIGTGASFYRCTGQGKYNSATAITGVRLFPGTAGTNTFAEGGAHLYGLKKS